MSDGGEPPEVVPEQPSFGDGPWPGAPAVLSSPVVADALFLGLPTAAGADVARAGRRPKTLVLVVVAVLVAGGLGLGLTIGLGPGGSGNTPQAVVQAFMGNLLSGNYAGACKDVQPSGQSECGLVFLLVGGAEKGQVAFSGHLTPGGDVVEGSEALVAVTGRLCGPTAAPPQTSCSSIDSPNSELPQSPGAFAAAWAQANSSDSAFGAHSAVPCVEVSTRWYIYLPPSSLGNTGVPSTSNAPDADTVAESDLQTALTAAKTYYTEYNQTYTGLDPSTFASIDTGLAAVPGTVPSSGPSVISLLAGAGGTYAVMAAWVPATQTCWAIMDSTASNSLDGQRQFVGTLYLKTATTSVSCTAKSYSQRLPPGSVSSAEGFSALG